MAQGYYDFVIYYTGAQIINAGKGKQLYDLNVQQVLSRQIYVPGPTLVGAAVQSRALRIDTFSAAGKYVLPLVLLSLT